MEHLFRLQERCRDSVYIDPMFETTFWLLQASELTCTSICIIEPLRVPYAYEKGRPSNTVYIDFIPLALLFTVNPFTNFSNRLRPQSRDRIFISERRL